MRCALPASAAAVLCSVLIGCGEAPVAPPASTSLVIASVTTGGALDLDGFRLVVNGEPQAAIDLNDAASLWDIPEGDYRIQLSGVAANCGVAEGPDRIVQVRRGAEAQLQFNVACQAPDELASVRMVFVAGRAARLIGMNADATAIAPLTSSSETDSDYVLSPDGTRIAFLRSERSGEAPALFVMNRDGTGVRRLASWVYGLDWAPDGLSIVFAGGDGLVGGPIKAVPASGGPVRSLTPPPSSPISEEWGARWSPDGRRIAFLRDGAIRLVNADGSGETGLPGSGLHSWSVAWSPAGDRIAYSSHFSNMTTIRMARTDGSASETLLETDAYYELQDWSADGAMLLLTKTWGTHVGLRDVYLLRVSDRAFFRLTGTGVNRNPRFWPAPVSRVP